MCAPAPAAWRFADGPLESASEAESRERLGLWVGDIPLMPNGTLDGFNRALDFDEGIKQVFRVSAILLLRQSFRDVASVRNLSISCCDQLLSVLVILSHSGGLLLIKFFVQQLRQLGDIGRNPSRVTHVVNQQFTGSLPSSATEAQDEAQIPPWRGPVLPYVACLGRKK